MDYNRILKNRIVQKVAQLDKKNGGDYKKTMTDIMEWAKKGNDDICKAVDYGDYIQVSCSKMIQVNGWRNRAWCGINFTYNGEILEYIY